MTEVTPPVGRGRQVMAGLFGIALLLAVAAVALGVWLLLP